MTNEEFIFYKDQILFNNIRSLKVELFKQQRDFEWIQIVTETISKFEAK